ncbi:MAG: shikimate kinase [Micromonosporaceae bacterium]
MNKRTFRSSQAAASRGGARATTTGTSRPVCVLIGPPGSGKSSVGYALAARWGVPFRDTDADIESRAGRPIPEIFVDDGEEHFRALEAESVADALAEHRGVLALGGGAVLIPDTAERLAGHRVVFLSVALSDAVKRVGLGAGRPLLELNPRATLRHLLEQRRPHYERLATLTVDTCGRTVEQVVDEIVDRLGKEPGG